MKKTNILQMESLYLDESQKNILLNLKSNLNVLYNQLQDLQKIIYIKEVELKNFIESFNIQKLSMEDSKSFEKKPLYSEIVVKNVSENVIQTQEQEKEIKNIQMFHFTETFWGDLNKPTFYFKSLFQRHCQSCKDGIKSKNCTEYKKSHVHDKNFEFSSLPYKARCMRKVCMDLACNRRHHDLTLRIAVQCNQLDCKCPHYVHPEDINEGKPSFWVPYSYCMPKPSKQIIDSYFLLFKK